MTKTTKKIRASHVTVGMTINGARITKVNHESILLPWPAAPVAQTTIATEGWSTVVRGSDWVEVDR